MNWWNNLPKRWKWTIILSAVTILIFIFAKLASAAPFLVCDPQAGAEEHIYEIDGVILNNGQPYPAQADGSCYLDLGPLQLSNGPHEARAMAGNMWGWSPYSTPLSFTKSVPGAPGGVRIIP